MTTIKNLPLREKYSANGSFFRWGATILVVVLVMFFEFYLFSRYSLWQSSAGKSDEKIEIQSKAVPVAPVVASSPSPQVPQVVQHPPAVPSNNEFHPSVPSSANPVEEPPPETTGENVTIVDRESMKLMPGADFKIVLRGVLELESNNDYLLSPERESALYNSCLQISKAWDDPDARKSEIEKCKFLFFASLNQKQMKLVKNNMKLWPVEHGQYKAPENEDQEKYLLKKCTELLSERVQK